MLIPVVFVPTQRNSASQPPCSLTHSPGLLGAFAVPVVSPEPAAVAVLDLTRSMLVDAEEISSFLIPCCSAGLSDWDLARKLRIEEFSR